MTGPENNPTPGHDDRLVAPMPEVLRQLMQCDGPAMLVETKDGFLQLVPLNPQPDGAE